MPRARRSSRRSTISNNPKYFPYRWGQAFWAYVGGKWGDDVVRQMLSIGGVAGDPAIAIQRVLGVTTKELTEEWHAALRQAYQPVLTATTSPSDLGRPLLSGTDGRGGDLNVGPAISPDGRRIAFLSERSLLSIDLFIADTESGKVQHKLTSTATDPHLSSLQFIHSAGGWDAESRRIAIATISNGRPAVAIYNAQSGDRERELLIPALDEIFNPTWAPDGQAIAFTGMSGGLTDLYVLDVKTSALRRLTTDPFADLQPAWSPDGRSIAFATDRFSSQVDTLSFGPYRIGIINVDSGSVEAAPGFATGKSINPQWSADSQSIYFISDRTGISNLYRATIGGGTPVQLTSVGTGLSGITATSPAMSVSTRTNVAAFSLYDRGNYHVHTLRLDELDAIGGADVAALNPAALPPAVRQQSLVATLLADANFGLPPVQNYDVEPYKAKLGLEAVGQPYIGVGADRFGAAIAGGIGFYFSDMLNNHALTAAVQVNSGVTGNFSLKDTAAQVGYMNQSKRWNWGVIGGQMPYLSGGFQSTIEDVGGGAALVDRTIIFRQTDRSLSGVVAYPFNRAQRLEFQGGMSQISFDQVVRTQAYSLINGQLLADDTVTTQLTNPLTLATSSAALVYDTSTFGATSPVSGQRYRVEAAPAFGSIKFTNLLADYRRYVMPFPFYTLAARVMHYGRYGSGSEDERLYPLFIGYPTLVRGYDINSFSAAECTASARSECPAFDRLIGSRLLVANLEFRFPLLRPFRGASQSMYGPVPLEVALFADSGVAWNRGDSPSIFGGDRGGVSSVGVALRANLMGFAVGQFDFARPLGRPGKGWVFQFSLTPGF